MAMVRGQGHDLVGNIQLAQQHVPTKAQSSVASCFGLGGTPTTDLLSQPSGSFSVAHRGLHVASPESHVLPPARHTDKLPTEEVEHDPGLTAQDDELYTSPFSAVAHLPVEKVQPSIVPEHKAVVSEHTQALCPDLPDDIVPLILGHCDSESLRAAHMVNTTWQIAAREQVTLLAPPTVSTKHLDRFPSVEALCLEDQVFEQNVFNRFAPQGSPRLRPLKALGLKNCSFKHPISDLASLKALERLKLKNIEFNEVNGMDACALVPQLTQLTHLEISRSSSTSYCMPDIHLSSLTNLRGLVLEDHEIGNRLRYLIQVSCLQSLERLTVSESMVDNDIATSIGCCLRLQQLDLPDISFFSDQCLEQFAGLTDLTRLNLGTTPDGRSQLLTTSFSVLSSMTKLQHLNLSGNSEIAENGLNFLATLTNLEYLALSGLNLGHRPTDTSPLSNLTSLTSLNLFGACTRSTQFGFLSQMKRMKALELSHNFLNDIAAPYIADMKDLTTLRVNYCQLTNLGLHQILDHCSMLAHMRVDGCWISTLGMWSAVRKRPEITYWSKREMASEICPRPLWYRKFEIILGTRIKPMQSTLRCLWAKERNWPLTLLMAALLVTSTIVGGFLVMIIFGIVTIVPSALFVMYGMVAAPVLFLHRMLKGAFVSATFAIQDSFEWLSAALFPAPPRTIEDRLAELV